MQRTSFETRTLCSLQRAFWVVLAAICPSLVNATTPDEAYAMLCGRTVFYFDESHGNQIEYFAPDGRAQLWYPGNRAVVSGSWKITHNSDDPNLAGICFRYGANSYNPVTKEYGGKWNCSSFERHTEILPTRSIVGDIFGLSDNTIPMVLPAKPRVNIEPFRSSATFDIPPMSLSPACAKQIPMS